MHATLRALPVGAVGAWVPTTVTEHVRPHQGRSPAAVMVRGRAACTFNRAASHLFGAAAIGRGLHTPTPWGMTLALDAAAHNPVLIPAGAPDPEGVPISWCRGGRRGTFNLDAAFRAWSRLPGIGRRERMSIPVTIATDPATGAPGLMLQWESLVIHAVGAGRAPTQQLGLDEPSRT